MEFSITDSKMVIDFLSLKEKEGFFHPRGFVEGPLENIINKVGDPLCGKVILPHHLLDPLRAGGKAKDRCDFLLQFESEMVLPSFAEQMELIPHCPEELEAFI